MPYKCARPQGKLVYIPEVAVFKSMSAVIQTFTPEGFVVAADGRTTAEDYETILSDTTQKIHEIASPGGPLALSVFGGGEVEFPDGQRITPRREFLKSAQSLRHEAIVDIVLYATRLCAPVVKALLQGRDAEFSGETHSDTSDLNIEPGKTICRALLNGYFNGYPVSVSIRLFHDGLVLGRPQIHNHSLYYGYQTVYGSEFVSNSMRRDVGDRTIRHAVERSCEYIRACADSGNIEADRFCLAIGGRIHITTVTRDVGFQWVPGFEPVLESPQSLTKNAAIPLQNNFVRQRWNRLFLVAVIGWAVFCLFVQPILMAREGRIAFESDNKFCYENYSVLRTDQLQPCLDRAHAAFQKGLYAGFGEEYDVGRSWSYPWYFRVMWGLLLIEIIAPPVLLYVLVWGTASVSLWIWRGSKKNRVTQI
jgi:hypothetical protein